MRFDWNPVKNRDNLLRHGIDFFTAQRAFFDPCRIITADIGHSNEKEKRYFCFGKVEDRVLTVRFTVRDDVIRIFGAGFWREGRKRYEDETNSGA